MLDLAMYCLRLGRQYMGKQFSQAAHDKYSNEAMEALKKYNNNIFHIWNPLEEDCFIDGLLSYPIGERWEQVAGIELEVNTKWLGVPYKQVLLSEHKRCKYGGNDYMQAVYDLDVPTFIIRFSSDYKYCMVIKTDEYPTDKLIKVNCHSPLVVNDGKSFDKNNYVCMFDKVVICRSQYWSAVVLEYLTHGEPFKFQEFLDWKEYL